MKMQRILSLLLALLCAATCAAFVGCNDEKETESESKANGSSSESGSEKEEIVRFDYFSGDMKDYATLADYSQITVTLDDDMEIDDSSVKEYIDLLCNEYPDIERVTDRAVKKGDTVYLYYEGYLNGEKFEGGSNMTQATPYELVIGSGSFIPGFEDSLIGLVPSENNRDNLYELPLTFPENYHSADLAGKAVVFKVYIEYIADATPAEYTEDFITKTLKFEAKGDDIKGEFEAYIKEMLEDNYVNSVKDQIWRTVIAGMTVIKYPENEVEYYYDSLIEQYEYYMQMYSYYGYKFEDLGDFVCQYEGYAEGTDWKAETEKQSQLAIKQNIAFHYIAQAEGIKITDTEYQTALQYYVDYYSSSGTTYTAAQIEEQLGSDMIKSQALFDKVSSLLVENTTVLFENLDEETGTETETNSETNAGSEATSTTETNA